MLDGDEDEICAPEERIVDDRHTDGEDDERHDVVDHLVSSQSAKGSEEPTKTEVVS